MNGKPAQAGGGTIRVMLVEDHQTMLWGLQKLIDGERPRMEVVGTARTCADAIAAAARLAPHVILLDLDLDGASSVEIIAQLLANGVSRTLVLSGERRSEILDQAVRCGARGILHKEASADQVLKAIEKIHYGEFWLDHESMARVFGDLLAPRPARKRDIELDKQATLTSRERAVVSAIVEHVGSANKSVAQQLFISEHTLRNHLSSVYHKLGVTSRLELYVYAVKHQLALPAASEPRPASCAGR